MRFLSDDEAQALDELAKVAGGPGPLWTAVERVRSRRLRRPTVKEVVQELWNTNQRQVSKYIKNKGQTNGNRAS